MNTEDSGRRALDGVKAPSARYSGRGRRITDRVRNAPWWKRHLTMFLCRAISHRIKRLIFLSSVTGLMENIDTPEKTFVAKLNAILRLAHNDDAIVLPMYIHSWLWKKCEDDSCIEINGHELPVRGLTGTQVPAEYFRKIAAYLVSNAPPWIIYGTESEIAEDIELLFHTVPTAHA